MDRYSHYSDAQLKAEIEKCEQCAEKPCMEACPAHCSPADFILAAKCMTPSDLGRAAEEIMSRNPLGHVCGIVCPDTFCMDACSRKKFDAPVNIPKIQAAVMHKAREHGTLRVPEKPPLNGRSVAVVGAGPAGLSATASLARKGYLVTLLDSDKKAGGACLMIPEARLPRIPLEADIAYILELGAIETRFKQQVAQPESLLDEGFDAVLVAAGQPTPLSLGIPGESLAVAATDYLRNPKRYKTHGQVAVVGGGAVAADCAVTAKSQGAAAVELFVRRTLADMLLTDFERSMLIDHRIDITTRTRLLKIAKSKSKLALRTVKVAPATGSRNQKPRLADIPRTAINRPGFDLVILALGNEWNNKRSKNPAIFYAGDCIEGASTVVEASATGKNAAAEIDLFLSRATATARKKFEVLRRPGSRSKLKSRLAVDGIGKLPVDLKADFFGIPILNPFLLSAAPATDGLDQLKKAYEAGWAGAVMKTAFDGLPIHIPGAYMVTFGKSTHGNCDNVSGHSLSRVCNEIEQIRKIFPDRLTLGSTGGPVTGDDDSDCRVWQSNTRKLESAGAMGVEYSLSCPQGGDGTHGDIVSQNAAVTAKVIDWVLKASDPNVPKLFKLTAAVTSIKPILAAIAEVFAKHPGKKAGVTLANSFPVLAFRDKKPGARWDEGVVVGMSGEGVVPISYLTLANASRFGISISGNGGVMDHIAAANFLALGAKTIQVCTVVTKHGVGIIRDLESGLSHTIHRLGLSSVGELIGRALPDPITGFDNLSATKQISQVKPALCQSCGNCTRCPYLAITLDKNKHPVTDPARCIGCTICVKSCFAGALFMRDRTPREHSLLEE